MANPPEWAGTLLAAAAVIAALVGIVKGGGYLWKRVVATVTMQTAAGRIIHAEIVKNGGSTMLDKVAMIPALKDALDQHIVEADAQWRTLGIENKEIKDMVQSIIKRLPPPESKEESA